MNPLTRVVQKNLDNKKSYRRMPNEGDPEGGNVPATGSRLRLKWGKQRNCNNDESNSKGSPDSNSIDQSHGSKSRGSESSNGSRKHRPLNSSIKETPNVHASPLAPKPTSSLKNRPNLPSRSNDNVSHHLGEKMEKDALHDSSYGSSDYIDQSKQRIPGRRFTSSNPAADDNLDDDDDKKADHRSNLSRPGQKRQLTSTRRDSTTTVDTICTHATVDSTIQSSTTSSTLISSMTSLDASPAFRRHSVSRHQSAPVSAHHEATQRRQIQQRQHSSSAISGETEEDRMLRLAMEMSLQSFREKEQSRQADDPCEEVKKKDHSANQLRNDINNIYHQSSKMSLEVEETRLRPAIISTCTSSHIYSQLDYARKNMSREEVEAIEQALHDAGEDEIDEPALQQSLVPPRRTDLEQCMESIPSSVLPQHQISLFSNSGDQLAACTHLSLTEAAAIERAIRVAEEEEEKKAIIEQQRSLMVALELQSEEATRYTSYHRRWGQQQQQIDSTGLLGAPFVGARYSSSPPRRHALELQMEFRSQQSRDTRDQQQPHRAMTPPPRGDDNTGTFQSEAHLGIEADEDISFVSNSAYSQFTRSTINSRDTARSSRTSLSRRSAMSDRFRLQLSLATNDSIIRKCHGVVKEGKKTSIYHATGGEKSDGRDVAIKVFKMVLEDRETLMEPEVLAKKEHSNLMRASKARVPVPAPLAQNGNVIFMRFMGDSGWPAPQLKTLDLRNGSSKWNLIYSQIMVAVRRLYVHAHMVHGDLNESHILVCPAHLVDKNDESSPETCDGVQVVLIDFGFAVDSRHASANEILKKDLTRIRNFFVKRGIKTLGLQMAFEYIIAPEPMDDGDYDGEENRSHDGSNDGSDKNDSDIDFGGRDDDHLGDNNVMELPFGDRNGSCFSGSDTHHKSRGLAFESKVYHSDINRCRSQSEETGSNPTTFHTDANAMSRPSYRIFSKRLYGYPEETVDDRLSPSSSGLFPHFAI